MRQTRLAVSIAFLVLSVAVAQAQLGPKDGGNLKPTDLERVNVGETAPDFTLVTILHPTARRAEEYFDQRREREGSNTNSQHR